jgi:hypothetical protein
MADGARAAAGHVSKDCISRSTHSDRTLSALSASCSSAASELRSPSGRMLARTSLVLGHTHEENQHAARSHESNAHPLWTRSRHEQC